MPEDQASTRSSGPQHADPPLRPIAARPGSYRAKQGGGQRANSERVAHRSTCGRDARGPPTLPLRLASPWTAGLWPAMAPMPRESVVRRPLARHGFDASRIGGPRARHGSDASRIGGPRASGPPWLRCLANRWSAGLWPAMASMPRESVDRGPLARHGFDAARIGGPRASGPPLVGTIADATT